MSILRRELRGGLRSLVIWVLAIGAYNLMMAAFFPSFAAEAERVEELVKVFPQEIIKAFGLDRISMADPVGFYATEVYLIVILAGSIFTALLGSGLLAKEEDEKTIEFLLARPVSRGSVLGRGRTRPSRSPCRLTSAMAPRWAARSSDTAGLPASPSAARSG